MDKAVYSLCYMCPFRGPIKVTNKNIHVKFGECNPQVPGLDELAAWQRVETGSFPSDFDEKGFVACSPEPIRWKRNSGICFNSPSKKIEFTSSLLEDAGFTSLPLPEFWENRKDAASHRRSLSPGHGRHESCGHLANIKQTRRVLGTGAWKRCFR
jgi:hypothetical protein